MRGVPGGTGHLAAAAARLVYVSDEEPGYTRKRCGKGFRYYDRSGAPLRDGAERVRIEKLVIPPAWTELWVCASSRGHIQVTGRDDRGRKQYIYHPDWIATRDAAKFGDLVGFGDSLAALRRKVARDLDGQTLDRARIMAAVVQLLDRTLIRVGTERYAEENGTFGLTTLRTRHVRAGRAAVRFAFVGKSGKLHTITVVDRRLAKIVRQCQELPGQHLFQYLTSKGERAAVTSDDVNAYLREVSGEEFTAKTFRAWGATVLAARALQGIGPATSETAARRNIAAAVREVAVALRNTAAVCRQSYIHPTVIEAYREGTLTLEGATRCAPVPPRHDLSRLERSVLSLLRTTLRQDRKAA